MDGLGFGALCFRDPAEAAAAACSSVTGSTAAGVVSCESPSVAGSVLSYTLHVDTGSGRTSRVVTQTLQPCDPVDLGELGPVIAAWFLALVVVLATRSVYTKVFHRDAA